MTPTTPTKDDVAREATALRIQKVKPKPAPEHMTEAEYSTWADTKRIFTNKEVMVAAEEALKIVMCRSCLDDKRIHNTVRGAQLVVRYEKDPLRAVGTLATVQCHQCGFDMHVNLAGKVPLSVDEERRLAMESAMRELEQQRAAAASQRANPLLGYPGYDYDHRGVGFHDPLAGGVSRSMTQAEMHHNETMARRRAEFIERAANMPPHIRSDYERLIEEVLKG